MVTKSANILSRPDTKRLPIWGKITMTHSCFLILCERWPAQQNLSLLICLNRKFALLYFFSLASTLSKKFINKSRGSADRRCGSNWFISFYNNFSAGPSFANYIPWNSQNFYEWTFLLTIGKKVTKLFLLSGRSFIQLYGCSHTMSVYHDFSC